MRQAVQTAGAHWDWGPEGRSRKVGTSRKFLPSCRRERIYSIHSSLVTAWSGVAPSSSNVSAWVSILGAKLVRKISPVTSNATRQDIKSRRLVLHSGQ